MSERLTEEEWDDVADLCQQAAEACEIAYEDHKPVAKRKAAEWLMKLAMKATRNSARAKNRTRTEE